MSPKLHYVPLHGSERAEVPGARRIGPADPGERIEVSLYLRPRQATGSSDVPAGGLPHHGTRLSREEYRATFGAHPDEAAQVAAFAREHNLVVMEADLARRVMVLAGTVAAMSEAFQVELNAYEVERRLYRIRTGPVSIPGELSSIVEGVFGLDNRPQARPFATFAPAVTTGVYTPPDLATLYDFPTSGDGSGQWIGIIELGGGYQVADLDSYFKQFGVTLPQVSSISVDGGQNAPTGDPSGPDLEVMLDIEVVGSIAPGASIVVYFAPNSDRGFLDAITTAVHDALHQPSVISISWGNAESQYSQQFMRAFNDALQAAAALGITVCCASGDNGSEDGVGDGRAHADFPASSPFALGCGGTQFDLSDNGTSSEVVWNDGTHSTGGGVSDVFDLPGWQVGAGIPPSINPHARVGRGVPDVAGNATGYQVLVDGQAGYAWGTSAVAPLWAALFALMNEQLEEPIGYVNPQLYQQLPVVADIVRDITTGSNGGYLAGPGWDACTGMGSPDGENWLAALIY